MKCERSPSRCIRECDVRFRRSQAGELFAWRRSHPVSFAFANCRTYLTAVGVVVPWGGTKVGRNICESQPVKAKALRDWRGNRHLGSMIQSKLSTKASVRVVLAFDDFDVSAAPGEFETAPTNGVPVGSISPNSSRREFAGAHARRQRFGPSWLAGKSTLKPRLLLPIA